ncbi:hypothetical protein MPH48_03605 [Lysinibacillus fusiformis]|uniref:hypothetical protein n=1 Tax=Lysinibacillus fusiformis TaxID=28031 RepID=UPI001F4EEDE9|nr:hypothetical protein [Lysinibacillus fusiformis]MCK1987185.1 hypothetical protein [Lysinibacillus fusiformis]
MKLLYPCVECWREGEYDVSVEVEINDSNLYEFECSNGHHHHDFIQNEKFEMLFDLGVLALQNSFQRESVSSFASSLERFYEYCIQVILIEENEISLKEFKGYWKIVTSSSERQLGAFYFLFIKTFGAQPKLPKDGSITFRNSVIHKGEIPSREKVVDYMKDIYDCIVSNLVTLKKKYPNGFKKLHLMKKESLELEIKEKLGSSSFGTLIDKDREDFEALLNVVIEEQIDDLSNFIMYTQ